MSEVTYFVYMGESSYSKIASDGKAVYQFRGGTPVAVEDFNDKMKFAGDTNFVETDAKGKPVKSSSLPTNNPAGGALSYVKMPSGKEEDAPAPTPPAPKAEKEAAPAKKKTSSSKKSSK